MSYRELDELVTNRVLHFLEPYDLPDAVINAILKSIEDYGNQIDYNSFMQGFGQAKQLEEQ